MKVSVSGINGFVGGHLVRELVDHGHEVVGLGKGQVSGTVSDLLVDYRDQDLVEAWPDDVSDAVVHLAGLSAVGPSFSRPQAYLRGNSAPVTNLCEGLLARDRSPRVVIVSTGAVYAPGVDVGEASPTQAASPYAVSKLLVETQCAYYRRRGLNVTVMRPFNHIGPGQSEGFLLPDLIEGVRGGIRPLTVGNLDTRRDYTDVRDVVRAYRLAVEADQIVTPVLNVCSSMSASGREILELVIKALGVPRPRLHVDPARLRPEDPVEIRGSNALIAETLGWRPVIGLAQTVRDTVGVAP